MLASSFMPLLVGIGWLSLMLLTGVVLRAKVGFLQKYLFPASLIGGVLGFIVINVDWTTVLYLGRPPVQRPIVLKECWLSSGR